MKRLVLVLALGALGSLILTSSAFAWSTIASESADGEYAVATAAGNANSPSAIKVRIKSPSAEGLRRLGRHL